MCSILQVRVTIPAARFWTRCSLANCVLVMPRRWEFPLSSLAVTKACTVCSAALSLSRCLILPVLLRWEWAAFHRVSTCLSIRMVLSKITLLGSIHSLYTAVISTLSLHHEEPKVTYDENTGAAVSVMSSLCHETISNSVVSCIMSSHCHETISNPVVSCTLAAVVTSITGLYRFPPIHIYCSLHSSQHNVK